MDKKCYICSKSVPLRKLQDINDEQELFDELIKEKLKVVCCEKCKVVNDNEKEYTTFDIVKKEKEENTIKENTIDNIDFRLLLLCNHVPFPTYKY